MLNIIFHSDILLQRSRAGGATDDFSFVVFKLSNDSDLLSFGGNILV